MRPYNATRSHLNKVSTRELVVLLPIGDRIHVSSIPEATMIESRVFHES